MKSELTVIGCDASTSVILELTETEHAFLQRVAHLVTKTSTYACEPTMRLEAADADKELTQ